MSLTAARARLPSYASCWAGTLLILIFVDASLQVIGVLETVVHEQARQHYRAFFSSVLGGITTNPALMTVHVDDHMVHRLVDGTSFRQFQTLPTQLS